MLDTLYVAQKTANQRREQLRSERHGPRRPRVHTR